MPREPLTKSQSPRPSLLAQALGQIAVIGADGHLVRFHAGAQRAVTHCAGLVAEQVKSIDPRLRGDPAQLAMLFGALLAELEHVAQHGDFFAPAADQRQGLQRRLHGTGVGVVAIVDDADAAPAFPLHTHGKGLGLSQTAAHRRQTDSSAKRQRRGA